MRELAAHPTRFVPAFWENCVFFYRNGLELITLGVAWFIFALPLVSIGPATIGAYTAVESLKTDGAIDYKDVRTRVRSQFVPAVVLSLFPLLLGLLSGNYAFAYLSTGRLLFGMLGLFIGYVCIYSILVLVPTFVAMSDGESVVDAVQFGRAWLGSNPGTGIVMLVVTMVLFVGTALLTIAVVLVFPGFTFALHRALVERHATE